MKKPAQNRVPNRSVGTRAGLLLVVFLIAGAIAWPQGANWVIDQTNNIVRSNFSHLNFPLVLGLDLQGGTRLEYVADLSKIAEGDKPAAMEGVRDVIERRVNALGVSEPVVQVTKAGNDWRLSVELAGIKDINEAVKVIGETPTLDFREENPDAGRALTDAENKQLADQNAEIKKTAEATLAKAKSGTSIEDLAKAENQDNGGDQGWLLAKPELKGLLSGLATTDVGKVANDVIDDGANFYVAQVIEKKDAGKEIRASHILVQWSGAQQSSSTSTKEQALAKIKDIQKQVTAANFAEMAKKYSEEPGADKTGGDLDWFAPGAMVKPFEDAAFPLQKGQVSDIVETPFGYHLILKTDERPLQDIHARAVVYKKKQPSDIVNSDPWKRTDLTGKNLQHAALQFDQRTGQSQVSLQFDDAGAKLFADLTKRNVGKTIGIFLDDQPISVPTVNQEITGGQAVITGSYTIAEGKLLAQRLQAGALPVPISKIAQEVVGPTLGAESVAASLKAALFGFLFVALFMILLYRIPGVLSVLALLFYAAVIVMLFKIIPVTLTLAGIAGFILSLGIAVDANVLIFERLKEELIAGKPMNFALDEAFKRAWNSIRDGNATTLIASAVLYWFSSSIIKGFALTLALGVIVSMFCAMVVTRTLLKLVARPGFVQKVPWLFLQKKSRSNNSVTPPVRS